jgi:chaperone BCS1
MAKTALSTVGSIAASAMVAHTILSTYLPSDVQEYVFLGSRNFFNRLLNRLTMTIYEFEGLVSNEVYEAVELYLTTKISDDMLRLKISKVDKDKNIVAAVEKNQELTDYHSGVKIKWIWLSEKGDTKTSVYDRSDATCTTRSDVRSFQLTFHKKHKETILKSYLPQILEEAKAAKSMNRTIRIHTMDTNNPWSSQVSKWSGVNLDHPASFDTLAMESNMKEMVMKDLKTFVSRRDYYRKVGKAWKRGYLLYGPPGTGKSSLIAAMANYLNFDIYDLELTDIKRNSELRQLLVKTANRSILVVEDIDCTIELQNRVTASSDPPKKDKDAREERLVTLSGFLNFIDGLWSSCGDERIIVFTTNHKEKLDPALLRPGRMDLHIHMSYCTPCTFKQLAINYLGIKDHQLFGDIEDMIGKTEVTPAEVAEQLSKNNDPDITLVGLIDFLRIKTKENEEAKIKKIQLEKENEEAKIKKLQEEKENANKNDEKDSDPDSKKSRVKEGKLLD